MCEITMKQDEIRIIVIVIFRIVIIIMYITPSMLHLSNYNLIILYEHNLYRTDEQDLPGVLKDVGSCIQI